MQPDFWNDKRATGVPNELDLSAYKSVIEVFERSCKAFADRPAFSNMGITLTYADLERQSAAFAGYLQHHTDLKPGDRIAVQMPNVLHYPIAVFGALRAGLVVVNTNPLYTPREMRHQFKDAGIRALVYLNLFGSRVQEVAADTEIEYLIEAKMGDFMPAAKGWLINTVVDKVKKMVPAYSLPRAVSFKRALRMGAGLAVTRHPMTLDDIAVLQYTGGTTGLAKGAMLTHGNLVANMQQVRACMSQLREDGHPLVKEGQEVMIAPLPLYHIYAFTANCMCMMVTGNHNVLITNPRDIGGFIKELKKWRFTGLLGLNTLFVALMEHPDFKTLDFSHLKITNSGGTALVKGPQVMKGYWQREDATAEVLDSQGWLKTGDIAIIQPDGYMRIVDRKKDMILVSGFNVYPNELEDVLASLPGVLQCAAIGVPDEKSGEHIKLFIVVKPGATLTKEQVMEHMRANVTGYKVPKAVEFREALPTTNVGKILRRELRDEEMKKLGLKK